MTNDFFDKSAVCAICGKALGKGGRTVSAKTFECVCLQCRDKENGELRRAAKKLTVRKKSKKTSKN